MSATTTTTTDTTPPPAPPAGEATVDGQSTAVTLSTTDTAVTARSGEVVVEVTPSTMSSTMSSTTASNAAGNTATTSSSDSDGIIDVTPLQAVEVATSGFQPDSDVEIWLHSEPMLLARAKADATGTLRTAVQIPAQAPAGDHRLVITGRSSRGETVSVAMAVRVQGVPPAVTSSPGSAAVWVPLSALALVAAMLVARRRFTLRSS